MIVRPYKAGDEVGIAAAHRRSILEICIKDYTPEQVAPWAKGTEDPQRYIRSMENNNERFWVVDDNGTIGGFAGWYGNEIRGFYMHPDYINKGVGRKLFQAVENDFWSESGCDMCVIHSTITARPFYEKMGFVALKDYTHRFSDSVDVKGWVMEKKK